MLPSHDYFFLLRRLTIVADAQQLEQLIERVIAADKPVIVAFLNQHGFNLYAENSEFRQAIDNADIVLRDGIGISVALRLLRMPAGINMNGTDFIPLLVRRVLANENCSAHAYGTTEPWLRRGAKILFGERFAPSHLVDGFADTDAYLRCLRSDEATQKLVVLAMGMPKQERVAAALSRAATGATIIVCGGAILDFCANKIRRAPHWLRILRLEWAFRLAMEPRRLFARYVYGGIKFLVNILHLVFEQKVGYSEMHRVQSIEPILVEEDRLQKKIATEANLLPERHISREGNISPERKYGERHAHIGH